MVGESVEHLPSNWDLPSNIYHQQHHLWLVNKVEKTNTVDANHEDMGNITIKQMPTDLWLNQ